MVMLDTSNPKSSIPKLCDSLGIDISLGELFFWLKDKGLTRAGSGYEVPHDQKILSPKHPLVLGLPCSRAKKKSKDEIDKIKKDYGPAFANNIAKDPADWEKVWKEIRNPKSTVRELDIHRIPADAIAFYRPFHFPPFEEWGIYIHIERLLEYAKALESSLGTLRLFSRETLTVAVLFEVFHHEFFHHLSEATATVIEVVLSGLGEPRPVYLDYWEDRYESEQGAHPHKPLEEALANAYAHNSLSFISRVKTGYKDGYVAVYQKALEKCWPREPAGYREAASYIKGGQIQGAADLLSMFLRTTELHGGLPLTALARCVFPSGHAALCAKPDIPTYLIGTPEQLKEFYAIVPAPNESYTNLFWPGDTKALDEFIKMKRKEEREAKKKKNQIQAQQLLLDR